MEEKEEKLEKEKNYTDWKRGGDGWGVKKRGFTKWKKVLKKV